MLALMLSDLEDMAASTEWMSWGLCGEADPELWFPKKGDSPRPAKAICTDCPVRQECLEYALENSVTGVWGGTTERQRGRMRAQLAQAA